MNGYWALRGRRKVQIVPRRRYVDPHASLGSVDDPSGDARKTFDQRQPTLRSQHTRRGGQCIGRHGVGTDHRHTAAIGQPDAGFRIDDVRVPLPVDLDVLPSIARKRNGLVRKPQIDFGRRFRIEGCEGDSPSGHARRGAEDPNVTGCIDH